MEQSSRIFQIFAAYICIKRYPVSSIKFPVLTSLDLSFAEETDAQRLLCRPAGYLTVDERISRNEIVDMWLVTRCGGLIEAKNPSNSDDVNRNLSYLHRTVRDFLELPQVWSCIIGHTRGSDFNPHVSLLQSNVLFIKLALRPKNDLLGILDFAAIGLKRAYQAELETNRPQVLLLDELNRLMEDTNRLNDHKFLALAIRNGLYHYVAHKIERQPDVVHRLPGCPLLEYAVCINNVLLVAGPLNLSSKMVDLLMQNGARPNQLYRGKSAWDSVLKILANHRKPIYRHSFEDAGCNVSSELLQIAQIFIKNGAIINKEIYEKISRTFEREFPGETKRLQDLMVAKGALKEEN